MNKFANSDYSRAVALKFLEAVSTEDVDKIMKSSDEFSDDSNWKPYGGADKNWDRVNVQTSDPVGALAELIINSIDAILMRKADEFGISESDSDCPRNMQEAVNRFFPEVTDGRLSNIDPRQRTKLAEKCVLIGIKRAFRKDHIYPTYTVIDYGEGQRPESFPKTLLSLGEKNKEGIPYVQGRFNMGSTGSIVFCTQADIRKGHYKFILSRRNTKGNRGGPWGWTLIRVRRAAQGEKLPVTEYFAPGGAIVSFEAECIHALGRDDIGLIEGGTVVKVYEYDIGPKSRDVDLGLRHALATSLLECALPIRLYDFDAKRDTKKGNLRSAGIADSTFSGLNITLHGVKGETEDDDVSTSVEKDNEEKPGTLALSILIDDNSEDFDLERIRIYGFGVWKMPEYLINTRRPYRVFYTVNGQSQARERASFYRKAKLDDLRNHLIVQVNCDDMGATARSTIFKPDRERKSDTQITRKLEDIVVNSLKENGKLREFAAEIRKRYVSEEIKKDEKSREFFESIVNASPDLKELLGMGDLIPANAPVDGFEKYKGKYWPTYLRQRGKQSPNGKEIPINTRRKIVCETDVVDEYLSRDKDRGTFLCPNPGTLGSRASLRGGKLTITVTPPPGAYVGQEIDAQFGFKDVNCLHNPLTFTAKIKIVGPEKIQGGPSGASSRGKGKRPALNFPEIHWVEEKDWPNYGFDEMAGACVSETDEGFTIYVNQDNHYLRAATSREPDESVRDQIKHWFKYGVGILTLSIHRKMNPPESNKAAESRENESQPEYYEYADQACRDASSAIAAHVVTIIKHLGGHNRK